MKKCTILIPFIIVFVFMNYSAFAQETIKISTGEWSPWAGKDLENKGFVLHMVEEAFGKAGYDVDFKFYPWKRTYALVKTGDVPASAYWYQSEKRKKHTYYSDPVTREEIVFFHKKDKPIEYDNLKDLKDYKVGVSKGNTYTDHFWELAEQGVLKFDEANDDLSNFRKLVRGRIDIFPCSKIMGLKLLNEEFSQEVADTITYYHKPLTETTGHILFSKARDDTKKLLKIFNKNLQKLKDDGTYDKYKEKLIEGRYFE